MKNQNLIKRTLLGFVCATALAVVSLLSLLQPVRADDLMPPSVPANIAVPAGNKLFRIGHATGTQNYICLPADGSVKFTLFTPQATLFQDGEQVTTHYFSPNLVEGGAIRATWEHAKDMGAGWLALSAISQYHPAGRANGFPPLSGPAHSNGRYNKNAKQAWVFLFEENQPVKNGELGRFDSTFIPNEPATRSLHVVDQTGNYHACLVNVTVHN